MKGAHQYLSSTSSLPAISHRNNQGVFFFFFFHRKRSKKVKLWECDGIAVVVHGVLVVGPIISSSLAVARFLAAERALVILKNPESEKCLSRICVCGREMEIDDDDMLAIDSLITGDEEAADPPDLEDMADEVNLSLLRNPAKIDFLLSDPGNLI